MIAKEKKRASLTAKNVTRLNLVSQAIIINLFRFCFFAIYILLKSFLRQNYNQFESLIDMSIISTSSMIDFVLFFTVLLSPWGERTKIAQQKKI